MRILLVHNRYGSSAPSGENLVVELERDLLRAHGHEVRMFERDSDDIRARGVLGLAHGALATPWNPVSKEQMRATIRSFRPHVVHAHNTFPLISPSVFSAAGGSARVLTLHNYRLFCPAAIPMRAGRVCTDCLDRRTPWSSLVHGCYRKSRLATLPLAASVALHRVRGTWHRDVEAFIALTEFQKGLMSASGLRSDRVSVKPNFYPGSPQVLAYDDRPERVVFAGRLSAEKGIDDLVSAWLSWGSAAPELQVLGDGPLRVSMQARVERAGAANVVFRGQLDSSQAQREIGRARLVVLPSVWFEGFPMVLREAFALGTPAVVSDLGPLPDLVLPAAGRVFRAGDLQSLLRTVRSTWEDGAALRQMSLGARHEYETRYNEAANFETLMEIYEQAMTRAGGISP